MPELQTYQAAFVGKPRHVTCDHHVCEDICVGRNAAEARRDLKTRWEHVNYLTLTPLVEYETPPYIPRYHVVPPPLFQHRGEKLPGIALIFSVSGSWHHHALSSVYGELLAGSYDEVLLIGCDFQDIYHVHKRIPATVDLATVGRFRRRPTGVITYTPPTDTGVLTWQNHTWSITSQKTC